MPPPRASPVRTGSPASPSSRSLHALSSPSKSSEVACCQSDITLTACQVGRNFELLEGANEATEQDQRKKQDEQRNQQPVPGRRGGRRGDRGHGRRDKQSSCQANCPICLLGAETCLPF